MHSVQDCSHCTKQKMTRAPRMGTRVATESIESYALKRLTQYLAVNLLIPRALFGFGRFFRRMRGRLRTSCCRRMRSRLRTGRGFSAGWCSLLARRRLRTFFRRLRDIRKNDEIHLQTATELLRYDVEWARVVEPGDTTVLGPSTTENMLTLVTCYPFYFIGPAPRRFVVRAHRY